MYLRSKYSLLKLLLMACLLLQMVAPAFACQHVGASRSHEACHHSDGQPTSGEEVKFCAKCFAVGHGWSAVTGATAQPFPPLGGGWAVLNVTSLETVPDDPLFKPPISV